MIKILKQFPLKKAYTAMVKIRQTLE